MGWAPKADTFASPAYSLRCAGSSQLFYEPGVEGKDIQLCHMCDLFLSCHTHSIVTFLPICSRRQRRSLCSVFLYIVLSPLLSYCYQKGYIVFFAKLNCPVASRVEICTTNDTDRGRGAGREQDDGLTLQRLDTPDLFAWESIHGPVNSWQIRVKPQTHCNSF